ncbi:endonuclease domain-containing protein [Litoribacter populi]|uniref:endonuclease domain-containing protein n=1 Tax=Litoribacter populi TaxID=2598460 RepID=UPI00118138CD|nr:endonuclease domain-containing protein [Litoribacter populi]
MRKNFLPYDPKLKALARELRNNSTLSEVLLWMQIKNKAFGVEFHRQVPINNFIVDFYCHELMLAIEIDGNSHEYEDVAVNDIRRQRILENLGVRFLRLSDIAVKRNMNDCLDIIWDKIEELRLNSPFESLSRVARRIGRDGVTRLNSPFEGGGGDVAT